MTKDQLADKIELELRRAAASGGEFKFREVAGELTALALPEREKRMPSEAVEQFLGHGRTATSGYIRTVYSPVQWLQHRTPSGLVGPPLRGRLEYPVVRQ